MCYCMEVPLLDSFHDRSQDHIHSLFYALSIETHPFNASCISVTTHLQVRKLTRDNLIIDQNHDDHVPFGQACIFAG